ncbi:hypothetical protein EON83_07570 [bacterium]|nr:MAG: hypothetical protein EON83_07570 [bacterium]
MKKRQHSPTTQQEPFFDEGGFFHYRNVSSDARKAVRLPPLSPQLMDFFESFASNCSIECCGISALVFELPTKWDKDKRWNYNSEVFKSLQAEVERAEGMEAGVIQVWELQKSFYKDDWLFSLRYLMENMEKTKGWR